MRKQLHTWLLFVLVISIGLPAQARPERLRVGAHRAVNARRTRVAISRATFGFEPTAYPQRLEKYYDRNQGKDWNEREYPKRMWKMGSTAERIAAKLQESKPGSVLKEGPVVDWAAQRASTAKNVLITAKQQKWKVATDPKVIEVSPPPLRLQAVERELAPVYEAFADAKIKPGKYGGGHIHVDKTLFEKKPKALRNILVDMYNNPLIKLVMRPDDSTQARTMWQDREGNRLRRAVAKLDANPRYTFDDLLKAVRGFYDYAAPGRRGHRYRDVNLNNLYPDPEVFDENNSSHMGRGGKPPTVEFRFFPAQTNARDAYLQARLLGKYVQHMAAQRKPLKINGDRTVEKWYAQHQNPDGTVNKDLLKKDWHHLIARLGLRWQDYKHFVE